MTRRNESRLYSEAPPPLACGPRLVLPVAIIQQNDPVVRQAAAKHRDDRVPAPRGRTAGWPVDEKDANEAARRVVVERGLDLRPVPKAPLTIYISLGEGGVHDSNALACLVWAEKGARLLGEALVMLEGDEAAPPEFGEAPRKEYRGPSRAALDDQIGAAVSEEAKEDVHQGWVGGPSSQAERQRPR